MTRQRGQGRRRIWWIKPKGVDGEVEAEERKKEVLTNCGEK